jgi:hypothetical protein
MYLKKRKIQHRVTPQDFYNMVKEFLFDYRTLKEITNFTNTGYSTAIQKLRYLEDTQLLESTFINSAKKFGALKVYRLKRSDVL